MQLLLTTSRLVVLEVRGEAVGYSCIDIQDERAQIVRLAVHPARQGQGFGRHLLADALDFAASVQVAAVALNTQWQNQASQQLYLGFGFRAVGKRVPVMMKRIQP